MRSSAVSSVASISRARDIGCRGDSPSPQCSTVSNARYADYDKNASPHRLTMADALEHRMRTQSGCELADAFNRRVATLADDVGRAEGAGQGDAIGVAAEQDDPLGSEPPRRNDAAKSNRAVPYDGDDVACMYSRREGGMVAGAHHVRQRQQRRHQRVIRAGGPRDQRSVGERDSDSFALSTIQLGLTPPSAVQAGCLQSLSAQLAGAI
jgi:hypothetical protein